MAGTRSFNFSSGGPHLLSNETTAKGTGLEKLEEKKDHVEIVSSLAL